LAVIAAMRTRKNRVFIHCKVIYYKKCLCLETNKRYMKVLNDGGF
jgi:hypothetical protein